MLLWTFRCSGNIKLVRWLCNHNVVVNEKNNQGNTPMHLAIQMNSLEITRCLLLHGAILSIGNKQKETAELLLKTNPKLLSCVEEFKIKEFKQFGLSKIHEAVIEGQDKTLLQILPMHHDLNLRSEDGLTPIQLAAHLGNFKPLLILLLWQAHCSRQEFFVLAAELQKGYDPKSKAYETFEQAQLAMMSFPPHRIVALSSLMVELQAHEKADDTGKIKCKEHGVLQKSSHKFFARSVGNTSEKVEHITSDRKNQLRSSEVAMSR